MRPLPYLLTSFCLALTHIAFSQQNYQDGYIIQHSSDTLRGQIDFRDWTINPKTISFQDGRGKKTEFSAPQIFAFFVSGETYRSYTVRIHPYSLDLDVLAAGLQSAPYDTTVFLRLLTAGKLSLYEYEDQERTNYFLVQRTNSAPEQLLLITNAIDDNSMGAVQRRNVYVDQLKALTADCPGLAGRISGISYVESDLHKLIFRYNNCGKDTVEHEGGIGGDKVALKFIPLIGLLSRRVEVSGIADQARMKWPAYTTVTGGIGFELTIPRSRQQFSFVADLLYSHLHSKSSPYMPDSYNTEQGLIDYDECQLDIQFRYRLPLKKVRPFVNIGFSNATVFNSGSSYVTDDDAVATPTQITREPVFHTAVGENAFNSYQFGILGGIGVEIRRFILEGRFEKGSSLSGDTHEKAPVSNLSLLAGISF